MRYLSKIMVVLKKSAREEKLKDALDKRGKSVEALKAKIEKLDAENRILRTKNKYLRSKVSELYERNKNYALRIRTTKEGPGNLTR